MELYQFNGYKYGKGRLVLAVVKVYVENNPGVTFEKLSELFPKKLQGSIGVFNELKETKAKYSDKSHKRHFLKQDDIINLADCEVVVCTEWGIANIDNFIEQANEVGYSGLITSV